MFKDTAHLKDNQIMLRLVSTSEFNAEKRWVPAYKFDICLLSGFKIGCCDLRIGHNDKTYIGGNIGYGINEEFRGNNYALKACKLLLNLAAEHGLSYLFISCNPDNIASKKTIEKLGCIFVEKAKVPEDNEMYLEGNREELVYRIDL